MVGKGQGREKVLTKSRKRRRGKGGLGYSGGKASFRLAKEKATISEVHREMTDVGRSRPVGTLACSTQKTTGKMKRRRQNCYKKPKGM